jgi:hypothetical protein
MWPHCDAKPSSRNSAQEPDLTGELVQVLYVGLPPASVILRLTCFILIDFGDFSVTTSSESSRVSQ